MAEEEDVKAPFSEQIRSFGRTFWIANWMELIERFAYYGVRVVLPVYMVLAISEGGPELTHVQKGSIYALWAVVQSFIPIFTGGLADRYGFKLNIAIATVLKIIGYLVMGYCIRLSGIVDGMPLAEARDAGTDSVYGIFFTGAMFLALGTAVFKPGLHGLIAQEMPKKSSALGWSVFYQMVNWGGFIGPMIAGFLRVLDWEYVFLACAAGIALNFIPLFMFSEPKREQVDERSTATVLKESVLGLLDARLFFFTMCFAGFWLMFYQLFDILPNFIDDWIDSRAVADALGSWVPRAGDDNLTQEWMLNINAGMIMLTAFIFGYLTGFIRPLTAIVLGIGVSAVAIFGLGMSMNGWWIIGAIALFSVGEMLASPTKMRYLNGIAPPGKQGLYMGYVNMTVGIGWSIGSVVAGEMYEKGGDKVNLARRYLVENYGFSEGAASGLERGSVIETLMQEGNLDVWEVRQVLWDAYSPQSMWAVFTGIGVASLVMLLIYDRVIEAAKKNPKHSFNTKGHIWVRTALFPIVGAFAWAMVAKFTRLTDAAVAAQDMAREAGVTVPDMPGLLTRLDPALILLTLLFGGLLVSSFFYTAPPLVPEESGPEDDAEPSSS
ncbi:MAG: dipeptide/tripeptide permease [Polyangiales bacterium]|jgi:dipeptide/tripeptide permease